MMSGTIWPRRDLGDGQPPAYVVRSPCCSSEHVLPAWTVDVEDGPGSLQLQCGRGRTDPLLGRITAGCGRAYLVPVGDLRTAEGQ